MRTTRSLELVTVEDYLRGELESEIWHEYVAEVVYALTNRTNAHGKIAMNCVASMHSQLSGGSCDAFRFRCKDPHQTRFCFPDMSITRELNSDSNLFQDRPVVIIAVLSDTTCRTDEEEKRETYQSIASLNHYVLLEQFAAAGIVYRRSDSTWEQQVMTGPEVRLSHKTRSNRSLGATSEMTVE